LRGDSLLRKPGSRSGKDCRKRGDRDGDWTKETRQHDPDPTLESA